jgi:hypothetical protein
MFALNPYLRLQAHTRVIEIEIAGPSGLPWNPDDRDASILPGTAVTFLAVTALLYPLVLGGALAPVWAGIEACVLTLFAISALKFHKVFSPSFAKVMRRNSGGAS